MTTPLKRIIANAGDRASLNPTVIPRMGRQGIIDPILKGFDSSSKQELERVVWALVGEGGTGKSVLLGQLLDVLSNSERSNNAFPMAAVLITCASVSTNLSLADPVAADLAFGRAVGSSEGNDGLLKLLSRLKSEHGSVALLIDTLDLLTNEKSVTTIADLIEAALQLGEVVLTCRTEEFRNYLQELQHSAPRLTGRIKRIAVPNLEPEAIVDWAVHYLASLGGARLGDDAELDSVRFIGALRDGILSGSSLIGVCAVPVRLALTCQVFADMGYVPEDLTVNSLYEQYWEKRVRRHAGLAKTSASNEKEAAVLDLASRTVTADGRLSLKHPRALVTTPHIHGLTLLSSEGVVRELDSYLEFFHQTFAEFAFARWLLNQGAHSDAVKALAAHIRDGKSNLWPLATSALLQTKDLEDYRILSNELPFDRPEAARTQALGALQRPEDDALDLVLSKLEGKPSLIAATIPELGRTPRRHISYAFNAVAAALQRYPSELAKAAVVALAQLIARSVDDNLAERVGMATDALLTIKGKVSATVWDYLPEVLLKSVEGRALNSSVSSVLLAKYDYLGPLGRRSVIRLLLANPHEENLGDLASKVFAVSCPPLDNEELVSLCATFWRFPAIRDAMGWSDWRTFVGRSYPRGWDNAQIRFIASLACEETTVGLEVIGDMLAGEAGRPERHVNVLEQLVIQKAEWVASELLSRNFPSDPLAVGGISKSMEVFATSVSSESRLRLLWWLTPGRAIDPRGIWKAQIGLAGSSIGAHEQLFNDLVASGEPKYVLDSAILAWLYRSPNETITAMAPKLRMILQSTDAETLQFRARLEGRLVASDPSARKWIKLCLAGESPRVARTAIKTVRHSAQGLGIFDGSVVAWFVELISTRHNQAALQVAEILSDPSLVSPESLRLVHSAAVSVVLDRMTEALGSNADSQLLRKLLVLLVRLDKSSPITKVEVLRALALVRSRLQPSQGDAQESDAATGAAISDLAKLVGTLLADHVGLADTRAMVGEVVTAFRPGMIGSKASESLASMFIGMGLRDNSVTTWLEEIFGAVEDDKIRLSIAQAMLRLGGRDLSSSAYRLSQRKDCPHGVETFILEQLDRSE